MAIVQKPSRPEDELGIDASHAERYRTEIETMATWSCSFVRRGSPGRGSSEKYGSSDGCPLPRARGTVFSSTF